MIVAKLKDAADYRGIHPMLDKALDYLNDGFLNTVGTEATHMEGNDLYATLNLFETQPDHPCDPLRRGTDGHRRNLGAHAG